MSGGEAESKREQ